MQRLLSTNALRLDGAAATTGAGLTGDMVITLVEILLCLWELVPGHCSIGLGNNLRPFTIDASNFGGAIDIGLLSAFRL